MKTLFKCIALSTCITLTSAVDISAITLSDQNTSLIDMSQEKVFGSHLFNGNFTKSTQHIYNPDYRLAIGDVVTVKMWGAFEYEQSLTVDSQGNIFIPSVGTVHILEVRNGDLVQYISDYVKKIYRKNVYVYADMGAYQNVSVFVTGNVNKPGLYQGLSSDSLLQFVDKASGINSKYGSYRKITILRDNKPFKQIDLYDFMLKGKMEIFAFRTGDVILIDSIGSYVSVTGEVQRPFRFESKDVNITLAEVARLSSVKPTVTNAIVTSYSSDNRLNIKSYPIQRFDKVTINSGSSVEFIPDHSASMVQINIEGEHEGLHTLVVPKGTTLAQLRNMLHFDSESNADAIQIYRKSVAEMQKKLIDAQLKELESIALTTPSISPQESSMRMQEAQSIIQFIERAKKVEPKGQIVISDKNALDNIVLQEGDTVNIPTKNNIVILQGEVALPGAFTYMNGKTLDDYIDMAGDMNERANTERILVIRANGKAEKYDASLFAMNDKPSIEKGDAILVLPKAEGRNLMTTSIITQILYQVAIATKVVLGL